MNTTGFSCRWDSGQVGFIYVSFETVRKEYGWKSITKSRREKIKSYLKSEVELYDQYLTGEVYMYQIDEVDEDGDVIEYFVESCGGFYDESECRAEGILMLEILQDDDLIKQEKSIFPVASMGV